MLTGSFALGYYGKPRMTRDLDFVVALLDDQCDGLVKVLSPDFYVDEDAARSAVKAQSMFNLMHLDSVIKVDLKCVRIRNTDRWSLRDAKQWIWLACSRGSPAART